jgi:hypothetical protein
MIKTYKINKQQVQKRLDLKTLENVFLKSVEQGTNCSPFESQAILSITKKIFMLDDNQPDDNIKPGQMKAIGVSFNEPAGKPLSSCRMLECIITIYNGKDDDYIRATQGITGLRRAIILRITAQALEQGVLLTQDDLAFHILHCGLRTLNRDIRYFKEQNIFVPTRGMQSDIGPGISHKVKAIELLLQRKNTHEIAKLLYHTIDSIERYTHTFSRVVYLAKQGFDAQQISFTVRISDNLVNQYLDLFNKYNNKKYNDILDSICSTTKLSEHDIIKSDDNQPGDKKNFLKIHFQRGNKL